MPTLNWIGKDKVTQHHLDVPFRTLVPREPYGDPATAPDNLIIHGDNLEALKALLPRYEGQVKVVCIDPPYNTGNEGWVYNDNVNDPKIKKWLGEVVGKEGEDLSRHDKWLCMMYPRLVLLNRLLHHEGILFVCIDDDEAHNLRSLMDEIFGPRKRLATFVWKTDGNFDNQAKVKNCHEYVLAYTKSTDDFPQPLVVDPSVSKDSKLFKPQIRNTIVKNGPKNPVSAMLIPRGFPVEFENGVLDGSSNEWPRYSRLVSVADFKTQDSVSVESGWSSKDLLLAYIANNFSPILDTKGQATRFIITETGAIESIKERDKPSHVISVISGVGTTQSQTVDLALMGLTFPFPKPVDYFQYLVSIQSDKDCLILDSFAGSGTTAHAVLKLNQADGGQRRFILIEREDYADTITAERVRRVIDGYGPADKHIDGLGGGFTYATLGPTIFTADGRLNPEVDVQALRQYIWYAETRTPMPASDPGHPDYLGSCRGVSYYFAYQPDEQTVLDFAYLKTITHPDDQYVVYADSCAVEPAFLKAKNIQFKKIPRDVPRY